MKREYVKPMMYQEEFVPNAYASGCAPGIDESTADPYVEECWYLEHGRTPCSNKGTDLKFFIEGNEACTDVWLKEDGSAGTRGGIYIGEHDFEDDGKSYSVPAYIWSNQQHGWHYIPVTELGGSVNGKPRYFNS